MGRGWPPPVCRLEWGDTGTPPGPGVPREADAGGPTPARSPLPMTPAVLSSSSNWAATPPPPTGLLQQLVMACNPGPVAPSGERPGFEPWHPIGASKKVRGGGALCSEGRCSDVSSCFIYLFIGERQPETEGKGEVEREGQRDTCRYCFRTLSGGTRTGLASLCSLPQPCLTKPIWLRLRNSLNRN